MSLSREESDRPSVTGTSLITTTSVLHQTLYVLSLPLQLCLSNRSQSFQSSQTCSPFQTHQTTPPDPHFCSQSQFQSVLFLPSTLLLPTEVRPLPRRQDVLQSSLLVCAPSALTTAYTNKYSTHNTHAGRRSSASGSRTEAAFTK